MTDNLVDLMKIEHTYPPPGDENFQSKIYPKREFYYNKFPERPNIESYEDVQKMRDEECARTVFKLQSQQSLLGNYINPNTPYKGVLIFHGTGTGKTCGAISIAEKFKPMVQRYGTKIHVLVSGPLIRENWKDELLTCTGETYMKYHDKNLVINKQEKQKIKKNAVNNALQYYKFISYRSFYKKVLGEKIKDKEVIRNKKVKVSYRKTAEGEFERDIAIDRITNLNNTLIIVDEAHNLTGNVYGEALMKIIRSSSNLKVVLLTATPMKNLADDIIVLLNFLRPKDSQIQREKIFTSEKNHLMKFKKGGIEYLKKMANGYVSYLRGADPVTFAKHVEKGTRPRELLFTKVIQCTMEPFQYNIYGKISRDEEDTLDRRSEAVASVVFPGLNENKTGIKGYFGIEGISVVMDQLKTHKRELNELIAKEILKDESITDINLLQISENKTLTGDIFKKKYLKNFSVKFHRALTNVNKLVWGEKGPRTAFIYSNLVRVGIEIFQEVLIQNGYLEFQENPADYIITDDTVCYYCGKPFNMHQGDLLKKHNLPEHKFHPATFVLVTGGSSDESEDLIPEDKQRIIRYVFNDIDNKEGKHIKFILGSKVMNEGISLFHVSEVHILDVYFNLGKVEQVIGRAIRRCSHYKLMNKKNPYPTVDVYKYAVVVKGELSSELELYRKAELKHVLIKKVERALKETAIDCPLNMPGNIFPEELEKFKDCRQPSLDHNNPCPSKCDYMKCSFKCEDKRLNTDYYDPNRNLYKKVSRGDLDFSTFNHDFATEEIDFAKNKIKEMYRTKYAYTLRFIKEYVKKQYDHDKELFDSYFVYKALDELIPVTENDFNNFKDVIYDKFNRSGYLIYINKYYIFQPFDQNENVPMYYRTTFDKHINNELNIYDYLRNTEKYKGLDSFLGTTGANDTGKKIKAVYYDFESVRDYYDNRDEFKYVGIIDKETSRRKSKLPEELKDVFKIREKRAKVLDKKRGTGIPSLKGAVCSTSKDRNYLERLAKEINIKLPKNLTRTDICKLIRERLLYLEKYSTSRDKNKLTYVMIPKNHKELSFPYNLEDRVLHVKRYLEKKIGKIKFDVSKSKNKSGKKKGLPYYVIKFKHNKEMDDFKDKLNKIGKLTRGHWIITLE